MAEQVGLDDLDRLLAHLAVDDAEAAELDVVSGQAGLRAVLAGGDQHVVRVRLGIETEEDHMLLEKSPDQALVAMGELYDWLGYVQETLVQALS